MRSSSCEAEQRSPTRLDGAAAAVTMRCWGPGCGLDLVVPATPFRRRAARRAAARLMWVLRASLRQRGGSSRHLNRLLHPSTRAELLGASSPVKACCSNSELSHKYRTRATTARSLRALYQRAQPGCEAPTSGDGQRRCSTSEAFSRKGNKLIHSLRSV